MKPNILKYYTATVGLRTSAQPTELGKKWFAFSKMEMSAVEMLARVKL